MNDICANCNKEFPKIKGFIPIKVLYDELWVCGVCYITKTRELMEKERTKNGRVFPEYRLTTLGTENKIEYDFFKKGGRDE